MPKNEPAGHLAGFARCEAKIQTKKTPPRPRRREREARADEVEEPSTAMKPEEGLTNRNRTLISTQSKGKQSVSTEFMVSMGLSMDQRHEISHLVLAPLRIFPPTCTLVSPTFAPKADSRRYSTDTINPNQQSRHVFQPSKRKERR